MRRTSTLSKLLWRIALAIGIALPNCNGVDLVVGKVREGPEDAWPDIGGKVDAGPECSIFDTRVTPLPRELTNIGLRVSFLDSQFIYTSAQLDYSNSDTSFSTTWGIATTARRNMGGASSTLYGYLSFPGTAPPPRFERASPWRLGPHYPSVLPTENVVHVLEAQTVRVIKDSPGYSRYEEYGLALNTYENNEHTLCATRPVSGYACEGRPVHAVGDKLYVASMVPALDDGGPNPVDGGTIVPQHSLLTTFTRDGGRSESTFAPGMVRCAFDDEALYFLRESSAGSSLFRRSLADGSELELATGASSRALALTDTEAYFYAAGESAIVGVDKRTGQELGRIRLSGTGAILPVGRHIFWWAGDQLMHGELDGNCIASVLTHPGINTLVGDAKSIAFIDSSKDYVAVYEILIDPSPPVHR